MMDRDNRAVNTRRMSGVVTGGKKLQGSLGNLDESHVNVAVRCRPMSEKEIADGHESIVDFESDTRIVVHDISQSPSDQLGTKSGERQNISHVYEFNAVFDCNSSQKQVYDRVCKPIVDSVLEGYNGTIFAYGQTGTGKTYTIEGADCHSKRSRHRASVAATSKVALKQHKIGSDTKTSSANLSLLKSPPSVAQTSAETESDSVQMKDSDSEGIIPRAFRQIFDHIARHSEVQFLIRASYLEIYQEEIHDLLRKDRSIKLELHEMPDVGVYVKDLTSFICKSITEIERVMRVGNQNRKVAATDMNEHSSRSHAIFMITVEQQQLQSAPDSLIESRKRQEVSENSALRLGGGQRGGAESHKRQLGDRVIRVGKLNLVDLAGSERQRKTNSFGQRQRESIKINLSLSALGNVINSLMKLNTSGNQQQHGNKSTTNQFTPYRDSKLTRLLQDSLGGNAKTLMIANIGPASYNYDETINTLNYASRAKCIRNTPRLNEDPKDALLRELQREISDLRSKLAAIQQPQKSVGKENLTGQGGKSSLIDTALQVDGNERRIEIELSELRQKLASLEGKLLNGEPGGRANALTQPIDQRLLLQGYTYEQELALEKNRQELASQVGRERMIRDELMKREEAEMLAKQSFSSAQQELDTKKGLIRQILIKVKTMKDEIEVTQRDQSLELDELDQLQYVLHKELKLKCLIMDNFIPNQHVDQLLPRIVYNEKINSCSVIPLELAQDYCQLATNTDDESLQIELDQGLRLTDSGKQSIRPRSEFERIGETIYPSDIRYKYENLIEVKLEKSRRPIVQRLEIEGKLEDPEDLTYNGSSGQADSGARYLAMLEDALKLREPDIVI